MDENIREVIRWMGFLNGYSFRLASTMSVAISVCGANFQNMQYFPSLSSED